MLYNFVLKCYNIYVYVLFFDRDEDMLSMASLISTNTSDIARLDDFDEEDLGRLI